VQFTTALKKSPRGGRVTCRREAGRSAGEGIRGGAGRQRQVTIRVSKVINDLFLLHITLCACIGTGSLGLASVFIDSLIANEIANRNKLPESRGFCFRAYGCQYLCMDASSVSSCYVPLIRHGRKFILSPFLLAGSLRFLTSWFVRQSVRLLPLHTDVFVVLILTSDSECFLLCF